MLSESLVPCEIFAMLFFVPGCPEIDQVLSGNLRRDEEVRINARILFPLRNSIHSRCSVIARKFYLIGMLRIRLEPQINDSRRLRAVRFEYELLLPFHC